MSIYENDELRRAKRNLGVSLAPSPDELLAAANKGKGNGNIANYTTENKMAGVTPAQPSPLPTTIEMPKGLDKVALVQKPASAQPVVTSPYQDFAKLWQRPITPEEEARRERAARAVQGVAGLGNLMSAFANLTYTGKGAPSQTLPTQSVDAMTDRTTSWKDKLKAEREKYQAAELGAKVEQWKAELDAQHRAQAQANADRAYELQKSQAEQQQKNWETTNKQQQARYAKADEQWQKTHDLATQRENRLYQEESKKNEPIPFLLGGNEWIEIPKNKWTKAEIASVYSKIPEEVRKQLETITSESGGGYDSKSTSRTIKPTPEQMEQHIGEYKHLPEVANALRKLAGLNTKEKDPKDDFGHGKGSDAAESVSKTKKKNPMA